MPERLFGGDDHGMKSIPELPKEDISPEKVIKAEKDLHEYFKMRKENGNN